jgi:hypothetical protein
LRVPASVARTGVQKYQDAHGVWQEYRDPSEVFSAESLASLADVPVTLYHEGGTINAGKWSDYSHGHVSGPGQPSGSWVLATLVVSDRPVIEKVLAKELCEISAGYTCDLQPSKKPGCKYDQKNIRFNHITLLPRGLARAGSGAKIRLDSGALPYSKGYAVAKLKLKPFSLDASKAQGRFDGRDVDLSDKTQTTQVLATMRADLGTVRSDMDPAEHAAALESLKGYAMGMIELLDQLLAANQAMGEVLEETATVEAPADLEAMEEMVGAEMMDSICAQRSKVLAVAKVRSIKTDGIKSVDVMRSILGDAAKDFSNQSVQDAFKFYNPETFSREDRAIVESGSKSAKDSRKTARQKLADAWKRNKGDNS